MIVIWRGRGFWAPWLFFGALLGFAVVSGLFGVDSAHSEIWRHHAWPYVMSLVIAGAACVGLGLDNYGHAKGVDPITGLSIDTGARHSFYGVPIQYWGGVYFTIAGLVLAMMAF